MNDHKPAVVLLSGGLDSATVLAIARQQGLRAVCVEQSDTGSVTRWKLAAAARVAEVAGVARHVIAEIDLRVFGGLGAHRRLGRATPHQLSDDLDPDGIPITYVPARNNRVLVFRAGLGRDPRGERCLHRRQRLDYSGYPDCRPEYIAAYEQMANLATKAGVEGSQRLKIHTPLINLTKSETIARGWSSGWDYALTHSCYDPSPNGNACGTCDSCLLRGRGFAELGLTDPALQTAGQFVVTYRLKEIFYTLQGEGSHAGRPAVFARFTSCNLWTGREQDRHRAICQFCDTDFVGVDGPGRGPICGPPRTWPPRSPAAWGGLPHPLAEPYVVCTGGEPLLQLDAPAIDAPPPAGGSRWLSRATAPSRHRPAWTGYASARRRVPRWCSPLATTSSSSTPKTALHQRPSNTSTSAGSCFRPMDGPDRAKNTHLAVEYCLTHPQWRLSLQTHKYLGIA